MFFAKAKKEGYVGGYLENKATLRVEKDKIFLDIKDD